MLRKTILKEHGSEKATASEVTMLSVPDVASVLVSSEDPRHPIDHVFDDHNGPGGFKARAQIGQVPLPRFLTRVSPPE